MAFFVAFAGLMLLSTGLAFWKGRAPERIAAAAFWGAWILSILVQAERPRAWHGLQLGYLLVDLVLLFVLLGLALRANRHWTIAAAALQLIIVAVHGMIALSPKTLASAYAIMAASWPFLQLMVLLIGTLILMRRRRTEQDVRSWSNSSPMSLHNPRP